MLTSFRRTSILIGVLISSLAHAATPPTDATLTLEVPGRSQKFTPKALASKLKLQTFTVNDPVYKKTKTYEGYWLKDVLEAGGLTEQGGDEILFRCADGYSPTMPFSKLASQKGMLAIREKGLPEKWQKLRQGKALISPAPYYVVWDTKSESLPWAYQVVGIEVIRFSQKYDALYPQGQETSSSVYKGFEHFKTLCLRCHSINLQGGDLGPELNIPKNITEYWDKKTLREFISNSSQFRARSKMPPFPQLKDEDLDQILDYLKWAKEHKRL